MSDFLFVAIQVIVLKQGDAASPDCARNPVGFFPFELVKEIRPFK